MYKTIVYRRLLGFIPWPQGSFTHTATIKPQVYRNRLRSLLWKAQARQAHQYLGRLRVNQSPQSLVEAINQGPGPFQVKIKPSLKTRYQLARAQVKNHQ